MRTYRIFTLYQIALTAILLWNANRQCSAQEPVIQRIESSGLSPGQSASLAVHGSQLKNPIALWTPFAAFRMVDGHDPATDNLVVFTGDVSGETLPGMYPARMLTAGGTSEAFRLLVDDLPQVTAAAESEVPATAQLLQWPCCLTGQLNAVKPRYFSLTAASGQLVGIEVFARRLNSDLDPVLRITDSRGVEVAFCDDLPGLEGDAGMQFTATDAGPYLLELRDVRFTGGARHFFHLRIGEFPVVTATVPRVATAGQSLQPLSVDPEVLLPEISVPDSAMNQAGLNVPFTLNVPLAWSEKPGSGLLSVMIQPGSAVVESEPNDDQQSATAVGAEHTLICGTLQQPGDVDWFRISVDAETALCVTAHTRNVGSPADVVLQLWNSEGGKLVEVDDTGRLDAQLVTRLPAAGEYFLRVSELASLGGPEWTYELEIQRSEGRVELVLPSDRVQVPRGGSASIAATVTRFNYDGPLVVEPVQLPASFSMQPLWLGAKQTTVPITLTASAEAPEDPRSDFGELILSVAAPDRNPGIPVAIRLAPPAVKKTPAEPFRSIRERSDVFAAAAPVMQISLKPDAEGIVLRRGESAAVIIRATRHADWAMPIDVALAVKPDQLPPGITIPDIKLEGEEGTMTVTAAADATIGRFTLFAQGTAKKDKEQAISPIPPIQVEVTE